MICTWSWSTSRSLQCLSPFSFTGGAAVPSCLYLDWAAISITGLIGLTQPGEGVSEDSRGLLRVGENIGPVRVCG